MELSFFGATQTVTGSKALLQTQGGRLLVDCGLFQGGKELKDRNRSRLPFDPASIDAVLLTHAHLDHTGYLPLLVKNGFRGRVYCTSATKDLCSILLKDSGHLLERDAEFANRHGYSKHKPALPLYTVADAESAIRHIEAVDFRKAFSPIDGVTAQMFPAGHILGAAMIRLNQGETSILFSGDLGRPDDPIMLEPEARLLADYLVVESTYGNRKHDDVDPEVSLTETVTATVKRGGTVIVPAFAVGRAQSLLYYLHRLKKKKALPDVPIFLDSPMAVDASEIFCRHLGDHKLAAGECRELCATAHYVRGAEESKALDRQAMPSIIISASGMATGGRILHHLKALASDERNTILLTGFQASGTRGAQLLAGSRQLSIHGQVAPVNASIEAMHMLSAHADADEIIRWLTPGGHRPRQTFVVHGEVSASDALCHRIRTELSWEAQAPEYAETFNL